MPLIFPSNTLSAGGYTVDNSCRFNDGDSAYMHKALGTPTSTKIGTLSTWFKRGQLDQEMNLLGAETDTNSRGYLQLDDSTNGCLHFWWEEGGTVTSLKTNRLFRDVSAWYHVVVAYDTSQATDTNRVKIYINGTQETSFATETYPPQDAITCPWNIDGYNCSVGAQKGGSGSYGTFFDGYQAETVFIDGTQYTASDFGEFDSDSPTIWKPIDVSGLTFGTNGYYLDFEDSANLGNDANGGTDFTEVNLDATDQATDTPTNNFCTGNPLAILVGAGPVFSEGNTVMTAPTSPPYDVSTVGTLGMSKGKFYWECKWTYGGAASNQALYLGIVATNQPMASGSTMVANTSYNNVGYNPNGGDLRKNGADVGTDYAGSVDSIFGFALDLDGGTLKIHENGTYFNSGTAVVTSITEDTYVPLLAPNGGPTNSIISANFGGCSGFTVSSGNADADGYGNFEYAVPSGYYALCTKNIGAYGG